MLKRKTIITTREVYSYEGKPFFFEYTQDSKQTMLNLINYAIKDCKKGKGKFTVQVEEDGCSIKMEVGNDEEKKIILEVLERAHIDILTASGFDVLHDVVKS